MLVDNIARIEGKRARFFPLRVDVCIVGKHYAATYCFGFAPGIAAGDYLSRQLRRRRQQPLLGRKDARVVKALSAIATLSRASCIRGYEHVHCHCQED